MRRMWGITFASLATLIATQVLGQTLSGGLGPQSVPQATTPEPAQSQLQLAIAAKAQLDFANAALAKAKTLAVERLHDSADYKHAKADLDAKAAARDAARASGTPQDRLDAGTAYITASAKVRSLEADAVNNDPACARADQMQKIAQAAFNAVSPNATPEALDAERIKEIQATIPTLTPSQLMLAQKIAAGTVPDLPLNALEIGAVGRLRAGDGPDSFEVNARVVGTPSPSLALFTKDDNYFFLKNYPLPGAAADSEDLISGFFEVIDSRHVLAHAQRHIAYVLEPVNTDKLADVAEYLRAPQLIASPASSDVESLPSPKAHGSSRTFYSIESIFDSVPLEYRISDASQHGTLRQSMRDKWIAENIGGQGLRCDGLFEDASLNGQVGCNASYKDAGREFSIRVYSRVSPSQLSQFVDLRMGEHVHIEGKIVHMTASVIELSDMSCEGYEPAAGGGSINVSAPASVVRVRRAP